MTNRRWLACEGVVVACVIAAMCWYDAGASQPSLASVEHRVRAGAGVGTALAAAETFFAGSGWEWSPGVGGGKIRAAVRDRRAWAFFQRDVLIEVSVDGADRVSDVRVREVFVGP